jgi:hypothetical protein
MAKKDHRTPTHMLDAESLSEEMFGFHAQQAIEKTLKAWFRWSSSRRSSGAIPAPPS